MNTDGRIVKNFSLTEMANNLTTDQVKLLLTPEMVEHAQMMQELREWYGKPLTVSSWYRTKEFNTRCKGASNSSHLLGLATDITGIDKNLYADFMKAWKVICSIHKKVGGVVYYSWGMHFDSARDRQGYKTFNIMDKR